MGIRTIAIGLGVVGCKGEPADTAVEEQWSEQQIALMERLSPLEAVEADPTNAVSLDADAAHFGRFLFYDTRLSADGTVSCATCHDPELGFADGLALAEGLDQVDLHTPTLFNAAHNRWFFWDGRADSLWAQATGPLENDKEQGISRLELAHLIANEADLAAGYEAVFGALPDLSDPKRFPKAGRPVPEDPKDPRHLAWESMTEADQATVNVVFTNITKAIAAYEEQLVTGPAPFDVYVEGVLDDDPDKLDALSPEAQRGLELFVGDALCFNCHLGPALTNREFHNIGLGPREGLDDLDLGRWDGIEALLASEFNGMGDYSDDPGAGSEDLAWLARTDEALGQYKVPPLRNVALTAPYMHGGHFETLTEVVTYYSELDEEPEWGHREDLMVPLDLSEADIAAVVAFLESLTAIEPLDPTLTEPPSSSVR